MNTVETLILDEKTTKARLDVEIGQLIKRLESTRANLEQDMHLADVIIGQSGTKIDQLTQKLQTIREMKHLV